MRFGNAAITDPFFYVRWVVRTGSQARARRFVFRSRVAGPNAVFIHEEGGTARAAQWAVLSCRKVLLACLLWLTKKPTSNTGSHTKERRKTRARKENTQGLSGHRAKLGSCVSLWLRS